MVVLGGETYNSLEFLGTPQVLLLKDGGEPDGWPCSSEPLMTPASVERFEELCLPCLDAVFRMARRLARDQSEADDLVQETYVRAFGAFERFELREHGVKPWLLRILHNAFYTQRGKTRRQPALLDDIDFDKFAGKPVDGNGVGGIANIDWDAIDEDLKRAVDSLPEEYRVVLLLWSFEDMSYKEIAQVCDCPTGTVMSRLSRARHLLGQSLAEFARRENVPRRA